MKTLDLKNLKLTPSCLFLYSQLIILFLLGRSVHHKATATELRDLAKSLKTSWVSFASQLNPELFSVANITEIRDKLKNDAYFQARAMLEDWSNSLADKGTRKLLIEALVKVELRLQANEVFSDKLVNQVCPQV